MTIELKEAKYKGVRFTFVEMTTTGGNRLIKFNFPGSDKQAIETQGKAVRTFPLKIIIPHENYFQERDNILRVLEDGTEGVLTHPTFGDVDKVINGEYTLVEKISSLGRGEINVVFEVNDSPGIPQQSGDLVSQVATANETLSNQATQDVVDGYEVSLNFSLNFNDAVENIISLADSFLETSQLLNPVEENLSSFRLSVSALRNGASTLIQEPLDLATSIQDLFLDLNNLYEDATTRFEAFGILSLFGEDDPVVNPTTVGLTQRKNNRDLIRAITRAQALGFGYENASQQDYATTEDLDNTQNVLEDRYVDVRENQEISNDSLELLDRLRVQAQATLDNIRVNTRSIITVETVKLPLSKIVYDYYGSTELVDIIADLNNIKQNAFVEGEIRILTA